jgi:predicted ArsR family transcriptional regulator
MTSTATVAGLARFLLDDAFGPFVADVGACLLRLGGATLDEVRKELCAAAADRRKGEAEGAPQSQSGGKEAHIEAIPAPTTPRDLPWTAEIVRQSLVVLYQHGLCYQRDLAVRRGGGAPAAPKKAAAPASSSSAAASGGAAAEVAVSSKVEPKRVHRLFVHGVLQRFCGRVPRLLSFVFAVYGPAHARVLGEVSAAGHLSQRDLFEAAIPVGWSPPGASARMGTSARGRGRGRGRGGSGGGGSGGGNTGGVRRLAAERDRPPELMPVPVIGSDETVWLPALDTDESREAFTRSVLSDLSAAGLIRAFDPSDDFATFPESLRMRVSLSVRERLSRGALAVWMRESLPIAMAEAEQGYRAMGGPQLGASSESKAAVFATNAEEDDGDDEEVSVSRMIAKAQGRGGGGGRGGRGGGRGGGFAQNRGGPKRPSASAQKAETRLREHATQAGNPLAPSDAVRVMDSHNRARLRPNAHADLSKPAQSSTFWRLDLGVMNAALRNQHCVYFVAQTLGVKAGAIVDCVLRSRTPSTIALSELEPIPNVPFCVDDVLGDFETAMTAGKRRKSQSESSGGAPKKRRRTETGSDGLLSSLRADGGDADAGDDAGDDAADDDGAGDEDWASVLLSELEQMSLGPNCCVYKTDEDQYELVLSNVVHAIQLELVDSIVTVKFGDVAASIFRLLSRHTSDSPLEMKSVASKVLIEQKQCREHLYGLLEGGFVSIQDVPRTSDHAPSRTFFLWYVDTEAVLTMLEQDYVAQMFRLKVRQRHLLDSNRDVLAREARKLDSRDSAAWDPRPTAEMTRNDAERLRQLREAERKLEWGIMHADEYLQILQY